MEINVTADGRPLQELQKLIEDRRKYLGETAEQATTAAMIDVLVSLRSVTKTASPKKKEIKITLTPYKFSYTGGKERTPCLRIGKARYTLKDDESMVYVCQPSTITCRVWSWVDFHKKYNGHHTTYLLIANSAAEAREWVWRKIKARADAYKGLARTAFSMLMKNTGSRTAPPVKGEHVKVINGLIKVYRYKAGDQYTLEAHDLLDYAKDAIKGGDAAIAQATAKACNKIAATINHRCKDLLSYGKLPSPFPEVKQRN